jgi:FRG domain protein
MSTKLFKFKNKFTIHSIEEYICVVKKIFKKEKKNNNLKHLFFRGQTNKEWELRPNILREKNYKEKQLVLDFYHYSPIHSLNYDLEKDRISLLTDMQHYEVPTRLLDWSLSPLSALYFAVEKNNNPQKDAVVYVLNPWSFNKAILKKTGKDYDYHPKIHDSYLLARALLSTYNTLKHYQDIYQIILDKYGYNISLTELEDPFAFISNYTNNRILSQRGAFTIHGDKDINLLERTYSYFRENAYKIVIKKCAKEEIYKQLNWLYINEYTQYPDFKGIKEIVSRTKGFFNIEI